jgi:hypothetical protein
MITDVSRLRLHLCTIITSTAPTQIVGENAEPRVRRLTGDIRAKLAADQCKGNLTISEAFGCSHVSGL